MTVRNAHDLEPFDAKLTRLPRVGNPIAREKYVGFSMNFIFSSRCRGGGSGMECNMSNLLLSAAAVASFEGSGSTEPRILDS